MNDDAGVRYQSRPLVKAVRALLKKVRDQAEASGFIHSADEMAPKLGLSPNRLRGLSYSLKGIDRSELHVLFAFAREVAAKAGDAHWTSSIERSIEEILRLVDPAVETRSGLAAEIAKTLKLSPTAVHDLGSELAGDYILLRRDKKGEIVISRFHIEAPAETSELTTFTTLRQDKYNPQGASGFIYAANDYIYAVGQLAQSSALRLTMLRHCRKIAERDLIGLRLGVSPLDDKAPAAHAVYCHAVPRPAPDDLSFTGVFETVGKAEKALSGYTSKLGPILELLDEALVVDETALRSLAGSPEARPWRFGVGFDPTI